MGLYKAITREYRYLAADTNPGELASSRHSVCRLGFAVQAAHKKGEFSVEFCCQIEVKRVGIAFKKLDLAVRNFGGE